MNGSGSSTFNGAVNFTNPGAFNIEDRSINTNGGVAWTTAGDIILDNVDWVNGAASTFTRTAGGMGTFRLNNNSTFSNEGTVEFSTTPIDLLTGSSFTNESAGTFTKSGGGTLDVNGSFTNSGTINVLEGVLDFDNYTDAGGTINVASGASVDTGGSLTTTGTVAGEGTVDGSVTVSSATGSIAPGATAGDTGTLVIDGTLDIDPDATLVIDLTDAANFDLLQATGNIDIDGSTLVVNSSGLTLGGPESFTVLEATGGSTLTGVFTNAAMFTQDGFNFEIDYSSGTSVVLNVSAVPEPSSLALLGVVGLGAAMRRRRR
ncbi:MAG TPA: hypothetical protein DDW52_30250 [Planctomycetaceae bacterium]|nr:hypothetical protein [Planctomycetaceae bacterium]